MIQLTLENHRPLMERALIQVLRLAFLVRSTAANLAALAALDVTRFGDQDLVYVTSEARVYQLAQLSGAAAASPDVLAPSTASVKHPRARWLRVTSAANYGPNTNAPLHGRSSGILRQVLLYAGEGGPDAQLALCMGAVPSLLLDQDGEQVAPLSAGYPGSLYKVDMRFAAMTFTSDLRGAPDSITSTSTAQPSPAYIIGQVRKVLAGISGADLGLEGVDRVEIGDAQLVSEGDAERAYVYSAEIRAVCFVTNPDEDLTAFTIEAQPELMDIGAEGRFDPLNFVARGLYLTPGAGLVQQFAAGVATLAGLAVASSPAAHTFTAQSDTYCDLAADGSVSYSAVAPDHPAPAQAADTLRMGVARTDDADLISWRILCSYSEVFRAYYQVAP